MSRNKYFSFQSRISYVLRFILICDLFTDSPPYLLILSKERKEFLSNAFSFSPTIG
jgi:hypothetical protein